MTKVTLVCDSDSPWFFCAWESPQGGRLCSVQSPGQRGTVTNSGACGGAGDRLRLGGNNTQCELTIEGAEIADHGQWTCALTDNNMDTEKHHRELEIMLPGEIPVSQPGQGCVHFSSVH